jgi:tellurite resistance protein
MPTPAEHIRCENDRSLFDQLLADAVVIRVNEQIARMEEDLPFRTRRRLLATSVRLSERMSPELRKMADHCVERLGVELPIELFVFPSPQHNAMCFRPEDDRLLVMFSSSLIEDFEGSELLFVIGHELGHHVYRHHDVPIGFVMRGREQPDPRLALTLFAWSRYAEASADRAGAYCANDIEGVSRSLFKLASGLTSKTIQFQLDDFLAQIDQMQIEDAEPGAGAPKEDWFSTHPFSPLRVKALTLFDRSDLVRSGGSSREELETGVQRLMSLMEPNYLEGQTNVAESMRRLLFAGALAVAHADGEVSPAEIEIFEGFFGTDAFSESLDIASLTASLPERIEQVKEVASTTQAMQVLRDLCIVARAEGHLKPAEREVLDAIAEGLGISRKFVCQTMDSDLDPD